MSLMYCMLAAGIGLSLLYTLERNLRITHLSAKPPPPPPTPPPRPGGRGHKAGPRTKTKKGGVGNDVMLGFL